MTMHKTHDIDCRLLSDNESTNLWWAMWHNLPQFLYQPEERIRRAMKVADTLADETENPIQALRWRETSKILATRLPVT